MALYLNRGGVGNILSGTNYTIQSPFVLTGTSTDIIAETNLTAKVTAGKTYYLLCRSDKPWAPSHGASATTAGKVTFWLYLLKTYDTSKYGYDTPALFTNTGSSYIRDGLWRYTIPAGMNMARVRVNTYALNGTSVTARFWDIKMIPEENFAEYCKISNSGIIANDFIEI